MINAKDIAENIKRLRVGKGMTQADLGERLFVTPQTVSKWERGLSCPDVVQLGQICDVLDVPIRHLVESNAECESVSLIAIDGGGTKTELVLIRPSGEVLSRILLSGTNPNVCGIKAATETLIEGIDALLSISGGVTAIFAGIAGCGLKHNASQITSKLKKRYPAAKILVESDIKNVIGSIENNKNCITTIMGTGSSVFGWDGETLRRAGGWGYIFDQAGSGYDIGREVISRALAFEDGLVEESPMIRAAIDRLGGSVFTQIPDLHEKGTQYIASFASVAFDAAREGDSVAIDIIRRSTDRICDLINHVAEDSAEDCELVLAGGLCANMDVLAPLLHEKLGDRTVTVPELPQIFGAARMCMELAEIEYNFTDFYNKFNVTYGEILK